MDLSKLATELKLPATATLEEITAAVVTVRNRADAADKASAEETITRLKNRIPAGQEQFFRDQLLSNRAATVALLESLPEQSGAEKGGGTTRVHNRDKAAGKTAPDGVKEGEDTPDLKAEQDKHLLELRNRMPSAKRADLVLQAMAEKPDIWPG